MFASLAECLRLLRSILVALDVSSLSGPEAVELVDTFAECERLASAGRTLAGHRVEETRAWQGEGFPSAAHWMAARAQTTVGAAVGLLKTGRRLGELPATREALTAGRLSAIQAEEISEAAEANPSAESTLLESSTSDSIKTLRQECRAVKAAVPRDSQAEERLYRSRFFRTWTDADGMICLNAKLPPDAVRATAVLETKTSEFVDQARRVGNREPREALAADAFVAVTTSGGKAEAVVHVHVDYEAYKRGWLQDGERCEIPGIGPVPVSTARRLAEDAVIKAVLDDGADVRAIVTVGRPVPAKVRAAVEARDKTCIWTGCDEHRNLELHHIIPIHEGGESSVDNLGRPCMWHHKLVTHHGWLIRGSPGDWEVIPPRSGGASGRAPPV